MLLCSDNGVVEEGVTQCGPEVTLSVALAAMEGRSSVCRMAELTGVEVLPVDVGIRVDSPELIRRKQAAGTRNFLQDAAMSPLEAEQAVLDGVQLAMECYERGYQMLLTGEMGIGNTTTSSAMAAVLLGVPPETVTGRGAGLSNQGLERKLWVIQEGIRRRQPNPNDVMDVLGKLGGFDIASMIGAYLGGAFCRLPVVADGVISLLAALCAVRLCPAARQYILPSHFPREPAGAMLLKELGLRPVIDADLALGEGTGAVLLPPMLDAALALYRGTTFGNLKMSPYQRFS